MKLKESIQAAALRHGTKCHMQHVIAALSKTDLADLADCLADKTITNAQISRGLKAEGYVVGPGSIARHRAGECACDQ